MVKYRNEVKHNPPKKNSLNFEPFRCQGPHGLPLLLLPLGDPSGSVPHQLYLRCSALQLQHHQGASIACFHLAIHPTPRWLYIHLLQFCNSSIVASRNLGFHCCRFHLEVHPVHRSSPAVPPPFHLCNSSLVGASIVLAFTCSSSAIPASTGNYHFPYPLSPPRRVLAPNPPFPPPLSPLS